MIYFCADDYGLSDISSMHIQECIDKGALNKISVFPNFDLIDLDKITENKKVRLSLHLNLVEGLSMAPCSNIPLLTDKIGAFRHTFGGLLKLNMLHPRKLEKQLYEEIKAQVLFWKNKLPPDVPFCIDSHQHTHMIPAVFKALINVLKDEKIELEYMRIPTEPICVYLKTPSLYFTYSPVNLIKQWLLGFLWFLNKKNAKKYHIPASYFIGILFSGKMDEKRVGKILPKYIKAAQKRKMDIEVLFHPGYLESEADLKHKNIVFKNFYISPNRKAEFQSVLKLSERRMH